MISIITPVHNANPRLDDYLRSMLSQTDKDFSLIVVNDGSTDGVEAILKEALSVLPGFQFLSQEAGGILSATVNGILHCQSDYVAFVDSDDVVSDAFIADLKRIIETYHPDQILFKNISYFGDAPEYSDSGTVVDESAGREKLLNAYFLTSRYRTMSEKCIRRSLLLDDTVKLPLGIRQGPDLTLALRPLLLSKKTVFYDKTLYFVKASGTSTNRSYAQRRYADYRRFAVYAFDLLQAHGVWNRYVDSARTMFLELSLFALSSMFFGHFSKDEIHDEFQTFAHDPMLQSAVTRGSLEKIPLFKRVLSRLIVWRMWPAYYLLVRYIVAPTQMRHLRIDPAA